MNEIVNRDEGKIRTREELTVKMRELGTGLSTAIAQVKAFRDQSPPAGAQTGIMLSDVNYDLEKILGTPAFYVGWTFPNWMRTGDQPYQIFADSLTAQYILAAGALMAKINQINEGRGSVGQKIVQEFRYQMARLAKDACAQLLSPN